MCLGKRRRGHTLYEQPFPWFLPLSLPASLDFLSCNLVVDGMRHLTYSDYFGTYSRMSLGFSIRLTAANFLVFLAFPFCVQLLVFFYVENNNIVPFLWEQTSMEEELNGDTIENQHCHRWSNYVIRESLGLVSQFWRWGLSGHFYPIGICPASTLFFNFKVLVLCKFPVISTYESQPSLGCKKADRLQLIAKTEMASLRKLIWSHE